MPIQSPIDLDLYKLTMQQLAWKHHRDANVKYEFIDRDHEKSNLLDFVNPYTVQAELYAGNMKFSDEEIYYLMDLDLFEGDFLLALRDEYMPTPVKVETVDGKLSITTEGPWWRGILWETVILSVVNELYMKNLVNQDRYLVYGTGLRNLSRKLEIFKEWDLPFVDFGTRRRLSAEWHGLVLDILDKTEGLEFLGTSNVHFAKKFGIRAAGTYAHELDMVYAGIANAQVANDFGEAHYTMMKHWEKMYPQLLVALSDTWGSKFFFRHSDEFSHWDLRHDSGDPLEFILRAKRWWSVNGEDPSQHKIIFSDNLDAMKMLIIKQKCNEEDIQFSFGIGTNLTNHAIGKSRSMVMKATQANGVPLVKLSDDPGKTLGPRSTILNLLNR